MDDFPIMPEINMNMNMNTDIPALFEKLKTQQIQHRDLEYLFFLTQKPDITEREENKKIFIQSLFQDPNISTIITIQDFTRCFQEFIYYIWEDKTTDTPHTIQSLKLYTWALENTHGDYSMLLTKIQNQKDIFVGETQYTVISPTPLHYVFHKK